MIISGDIVLGMADIPDIFLGIADIPDIFFFGSGYSYGLVQIAYIG